MPTDLDIARAARLRPITEIAAGLGLPIDEIEPYGRYKAKLPLSLLARHPPRPDARLVLVTAISPTPAGEGKTTTTVGLGDALNRLGRRTIVCLREPSLGPVFGLKGGAAGGGHAQVVPMEDINLHFTGDLHAVAAAHNLLSALIDNHLQHGNALGLDPRRISWKRVLDMNDRALRHVTLGLGGPAHGVPRESGFDIVVASEVMAILCLSRSLAELKQRLARIVIGQTHDGRAVSAGELQAAGAMTALLRDALAPNLVQTLEGNPALIHGGPFANIAHGCNSVAATRAALGLADIVVTEAGFGAELGAEKFVDIKCRASGLRADAAVCVATLRALKYHGGAAASDLSNENLDALRAGLPNLQQHIHILRQVLGLPVVVALNPFPGDSAAELEWLQRHLAEQGVPCDVARHWAEGGAGAEALARAVLQCLQQPAAMRFVYRDEDSLWDKLNQVATRVYGAAEVIAPPAVRQQLEALQAAGHGALPVCIAKTPYAFSGDAALRGATTGQALQVREVRLAAGAGFVVVICGDVMTMPGLPRQPAAAAIDVDDEGRISGLF